MSAYALLPSKGGVKLKAINAEAGDVRTSMASTRRRLSGKMTMPDFAGVLSNMLAQPVTDMTELEGVYDFDLEWSAEDAAGNSLDSAPSLSTVLQEKLGLRLESTKAAVDLYVIDHVERIPTDN
jgi:uncharacterized protein (TIGR03435 family)